MSFIVSLGRVKAFEDNAVNEMFESGFGEIPMLDISVDFHNQHIYEMFKLHTRNKFLEPLLTGLIDNYILSSSLKKLIKDDKDLEERIKMVIKETDMREATRTFFTDYLKIEVKDDKNVNNNDSK